MKKACQILGPVTALLMWLVVGVVAAQQADSQKFIRIDCETIPLERIRDLINEQVRTLEIAQAGDQIREELEQDRDDLVNEWDRKHLLLLSIWQKQLAIERAQQEIKKIEKDIADIKVTFLKKCRHVRVSYLLLSQDEFSADEAGSVVFDRIERNAKRYIVERLAPILITGHTILENSRLKQDVIRSISGGHVETSGAEPVFVLGIPGQLNYTTICILQKYNLYPEFIAEHEVGGRAQNPESPVNTTRILSQEDLPQSFFDSLDSTDQQKAITLLNECSFDTERANVRFNELSTEYLRYLNERMSMLDSVRQNKRAMEKKLYKITHSDQAHGVEFVQTSEETSKFLNRHVTNYERIFLWVGKASVWGMSEVSLNSAFEGAALNAFTALCSQAESFLGMNISTVRNGVLVEDKRSLRKVDHELKEIYLAGKQRILKKELPGHYLVRILVGIRVGFNEHDENRRTISGEGEGPYYTPRDHCKTDLGALIMAIADVTMRFDAGKTADLWEMLKIGIRLKINEEIGTDTGWKKKIIKVYQPENSNRPIFEVVNGQIEIAGHDTCQILKGIKGRIIGNKHVLRFMDDDYGRKAYVTFTLLEGSP